MIIPGNHRGGSLRCGGTGLRKALTVQTQAAKNHVKKIAEINWGRMEGASA